ncbi:MAG: PD40 domain-containing protein [Candidatus Goldbacteria bacterium]|nr:PD40 domain-containing protein [Candidatus Goldiibacteriota bacterium]
MKKILLIVSVFVLAAVFTGCAQIKGIFTTDSLKGLIVYAGVEGDGNGTFIYAISPDGKWKKRLTTGVRSDNYPAVSPDGKSVVFSSADEKYKNRLYIMDSDGGKIREIASTEHDAELASWSPDGKRIAFLDRDSDHVTSIYVINSNGTGLKKIVSDCAHHDDYQYVPEWSADGKYILYNKINTDDKDGNMPECLYLVNTDGSGEKLLAGNDNTRIDGCFSPDEKKVAYYMERKEMDYNRFDNTGIFIMNFDGTGETYLASGYRPVWSPDGTYIAFTAGNLNLTNCILLMYPDGTSPKGSQAEDNADSEEYEDEEGNDDEGEDESSYLRITFDDVNGVKDPVWSPDSKKIAYVTETTEIAEGALWVADVSGNSQMAIAKNVLGRSRPSWR